LVLGLAASDDGDVLFVETDADGATADNFFSTTGFLLLQLTQNISKRKLTIKIAKSILLLIEMS